MNQPMEREREFEFREDDFRFISSLVHKQTGIVLAEHKKDMVYSRLVRRLRALKLGSFAEYCELLASDAGEDEISNLINAITTNLTSFFREGHHFEHLRDELLLPIAASKTRRLRIWSAGCSQGMEPYSIAMAVKSAFKNIVTIDAKILATDIDTNMLDKGMAGSYPIEQYSNIPAPYRANVQKNERDETIQMSLDLQKLIAFKHLNLLETWPMKGPFDAIFCRNVVIYFDKPTQAKLFARMADLLPIGGWLYIGHSENLFKVCDRFELCGRTIYRRVR